MAERDYYRSDNERDRDRDRDVYLDNRTGIGASEGRGYRAEFGSDRGSDRQYPRDDRQGGDRQRGYSSYGQQRESQSFRPADYHADYSQGRYGDESYGARSYQAGYRRQNEGQGEYQSRSYGGDRDYGSMSNMFRGEDAGMAAFNAYEGGRDSRSRYGADRDHDRGGRDQHRGFWDRAGDTVASWLGDDEARRRHEQDVRASHRGKGPKGYKRSDDRIREDVNERLSDDLWLDASNIEVEVKDSEITLTGTVGSRDDRRYAERIAESVSGATHVQNNLRVDANAGATTAGGASAASSASASGGSAVSGDLENDVLARQAAGKH